MSFTNKRNYVDLNTAMCWFQLTLESRDNIQSAVTEETDWKQPLEREHDKRHPQLRGEEKKKIIAVLINFRDSLVTTLNHCFTAHSVSTCVTASDSALHFSLHRFTTQLLRLNVQQQVKYHFTCHYALYQPHSVSKCVKTSRNHYSKLFCYSAI